MLFLYAVSNIKSMLIIRYIAACEMKSFKFRFSPCAVHFPASLLEIPGFLWPSGLSRDRCDRINERIRYWVNFISELSRFCQCCKSSQKESVRLIWRKVETFVSPVQDQANDASNVIRKWSDTAEETEVAFRADTSRGSSPESSHHWNE